VGTLDAQVDTRPPAASAARAQAGQASAVTPALAAAPARRATPPLQPGTLFAQRYRIEQALGRGGMGAVYRARDCQVDETVALKLLQPEAVAADPSLLERFKQELRLARRITHRSVVRTHDLGVAEGVPYISMECVEGITLKQLIRSRGALPLGVGLSVAKQLAQGLGAAHEVGIVHRDVKPQNVLIVPETGELKVTDFGIARTTALEGAAGLTAHGTALGTPDYMPPEQALGLPADARSDLYSLAVVLFEAFTGRLPFEKDSALEVVMAHLKQGPPAPSGLVPGLPRALDQLILRGLEKDPARRWQSTAELLQALSAVSAGLEGPRQAA
jgi:serine/threonine-protein kinase